jgi:hypothetical protein
VRFELCNVRAEFNDMNKEYLQVRTVKVVHLIG